MVPQSISAKIQSLIPIHNHLATEAYPARLNLLKAVQLNSLLPYSDDYDVKGIRYGTDE